MQAFLSFTQKTEKSGGTLFTVVSRRFLCFLSGFFSGFCGAVFVIRTDGTCLHSRFKMSPGVYFETGNPADQGGFPAAVCPLFHGCARFRVRKSLLEIGNQIIRIFEANR